MLSIGIDLGTTNSVASWIQGNKPVVILNRDDRALTPSVVSFRRDGQGKGQYLIGVEAVRYAEHAPRDTIYSVKRLMGLNFDDPKVQEVRGRLAYAIKPATEPGDVGARVEINGRLHTPIEISTMILRQIKDDCTQRLGQAVEGATITVPAYFQDCQRNATREAGERAGLRLRPLLNEPIAAALAFGLAKEARGEHRLLVYDLGGGTFDVSVVQIAGDNIQVLDMAGDMWLGGDDFDHKIADRIFAWLDERYGFDGRDDPRLRRRVKTLAEAAKCTLSKEETCQVLEPFLTHDPGKGPISLDLALTRRDFEADIAPKVQHSLELVETVLARNHLTSDQLTAVLLVGGSTLVPLVRQVLEQRFGKAKVRHDVEPMHCVSLGAALWNQRFPMDRSGRISMAMFDRTGLPTPMDLGVEIFKDGNPRAFEPIVPRGTPWPMREPLRKTFRPTAENQRLLRVPVLQGTSTLSTLNSCQGVIEYPLPDGIPANTPVSVGLRIDEHGNVAVEIDVVGRSELRREWGIERNRPMLTEEEMKRIGKWKEALENAVQLAQQFLSRYRTHCPAEDARALTDLIEQGRQALEAGDREKGQPTQKAIIIKILGCGTASVLFLAQRAQEMAEKRLSAQIALVKVKLEKASRDNDARSVQELSDNLTMLINQVFGTRSAKYGGPLEGQLTLS
jgi:molecular chaperone DnaK